MIGPGAGVDPSTGQAPPVEIYRLLDGDPLPFVYNLAASYSPYGAGFLGGVRVASINNNSNNTNDVLTIPGPSGGAHVIAGAGQALQDFQTFTPSTLFQNFAFDPSFTGGAFIG